MARLRGLTFQRYILTLQEERLKFLTLVSRIRRLNTYIKKHNKSAFESLQMVLTVLKSEFGRNTLRTCVSGHKASIQTIKCPTSKSSRSLLLLIPMENLQDFPAVSYLLNYACFFHANLLSFPSVYFPLQSTTQVQGRFVENQTPILSRVSFKHQIDLIHVLSCILYHTRTKNLKPTACCKKGHVRRLESSVMIDEAITTRKLSF